MSSEIPARVLLEDRAFRGLFLAMLVSNVGSWMQGFAEQWAVVQLAGPEAAAWSGRLSFALGVALLVLTPFGGAVADRFDRRRMLALSQLWLALVALAMGLLAQAGALTLGRLLGLALATGMGIALMGPAFHSLLPDLVPPDRLAAASGLLSLQFNLSRIAGPALAALLLPLAGLGANFLVNALSFLPLVVLAPRLASAAHFREPEREGTYREALRLCADDPGLRRVMLLSVCVGLFAFSYHAFVAVYATRYLGLGAGGAASLLAAYGIGAIGGALWVVRDRGGELWTPLFSGLLSYGALLIAVAVFPWPRIAPLLVLGLGASHAVFGSYLTVAVQRGSPDFLRGRITALFFTAVLGLMPLGNLAAGEVAQLLGHEGVRWVLGTEGFLLLALVSGFWIRKPAEAKEAG